MKPYEFLPHTADTKIRAYGKTVEEAFVNSALATADTITDHTKIKQTVEKKISVSSENQEALLYDFLEEIIVLLDTEGFLLSEVKDLKIKENKLTATFIGDIHPENYEIKTHVKAITYQEMFIKEDNNIITIQFVLDL
tara:strand:- start:24 stop:437 length:414 start_codon:yes stop_codon:yes gene_type:complete